MDFDAQRLAALEDELKRDLEAVSRVRRLMTKPVLPKADDRQAVLPINIVVGESLALRDDDDDEGPVTSLRGTIESIINADHGIKWTNQKMVNHLRTIGYPLKAKKPIYSVGQAMQKLTEAGKIRVVRRGTGNTPNLYRGKEQSVEGTLTVEHSQAV